MLELLLTVVIVLAIVGVLLWWLNTYVTILAQPFKTLINGVVVLCAIIYLISVLLHWHPVHV